MTKQEREKFYDEEIAPALLTLAEKCNKAGLSFLAVAEWEPGDIGRTMHYVQPYGPQMDWAAAAARSGGNVDALIGFLVNSAKASGHSSAYLMQLGVPMKPAFVAHATKISSHGDS